MRRIFILTILCLWPLIAKAQSTSVTPVHGWLLGPSTLTDSANMSCILFNQFSDGSGLRFNIRNEEVETITIIYRDNIFDPNLTTTYKTIIQTSGTYRQVLDGYAYGQNTLTITPPDPAEFYGELKRNSRLTIAVPKDQRIFNLRALAENLEKTKNCAYGQPQQQIVLDPTKEIHIFADLKTSTRPTIGPNIIWRAQRGERISDVMKRWSEQSGKDVSWRNNSNPILSKDFIYEGRQEDALQKLFEIIQG